MRHKTRGRSTYNEGQSRDKGEKQSSSSRGQIGDDDFGEQHNHGVTDLVDDGTTTESRDAIRSGFDDRTDHVEEDTDNDEFKSTENITDFGGRGLKWGSSVFESLLTKEGLTWAAAAMTDRRTLMVESKECVLLKTRI